ncbi:Phage terminase, large subunit GpA [Sphingomonas gellani]|uniref:Phage terminase, large subunit GpA n=1 Tax=Sphingomonas gellani TaxID=1166340 RepID=A0A1H7ZYQ3_9SPHN|nr:terminase gpA endonuclease subunit [Sphingomonas gellani]SEM62629.1 Phage terminase, large subunit GpA [Sphingomonas gellani]
MRFEYDRFGSVAGGVLTRNAKRLDKALADGLRPPPRLTVSEWAAINRKFPEDAPIPGDWNHETAPELVEIMDALSPHDPCEEVSLIKCAQSGGSASAENWLGFISDLAPGPVLFIQATFKAATAWAAEKFWPMVGASPKLNPDRRGTIRAQGLANGDGSTTQKVLFSRSSGYILLTGANSAADLRQRTVRYAIEDDLDQFPSDLDGQGSPEGMVDERLKVWRSRGLSKRLKISTPTIKGSSKIEAAYQKSDRRRYHFKCPECGSRFVPDWSDIQWADDDHENAYLVPPCCGVPVEHWRKGEMKLADGWLSDQIDGQPVSRVLDEETFQAFRAKMPASRKRGFALLGEISTFQSWGEMAVGFRDAQGDVAKLKTWTNLKRGIVFEVASNTPDYEQLMTLREQDWGVGRMPIGPLVVTLGCDVQGDGIYVEKVGWGPRKESWQLDARFIPGATDVPGEGAWKALDEYSQRGTAFPGGKVLPIDWECVDAGYHTPAAHAYCARRPRRLAVYGRAGWALPLLGRGEAIAYEQQGRRAGRARAGQDDKAYIVGVNNAKLSWYGFLRETMKAVAAAIESATPEVVPVGRVHLSRDTPNDWFEQATAETIEVRMIHGFPDRRWIMMPGRQNHYLDCRVYNEAAAEKLMLDTLTEMDWAALRVDRYAPRDARQGDLLAPALTISPVTPAPVPVAPDPAPQADTYFDVGDSYL